MTGRRLAATVLGLLLVLGLASATSLGTFEDVALSAQADDPPCTADATLLDTSGSVITLATALLTNIGSVELSSFSGDCSDMTGTVVVIGEDPWLSGNEEILATQTFALPSEPTGVETLVVSAGDALDGLLSLTVVATEVRVAFVPA